VAFLVTDILCWMKASYFHPDQGNSFPRNGPLKSQLIPIVLTPSRNFYSALLGLSVGLISVHIRLCVKMRQDYFCAKERPIIAGDKRTNILTV